MTAGNSTASITGAGFIGEDKAQQKQAGVTRCRAHSARSRPAAVKRLSSDGRLWRAIKERRSVRKTASSTTARPAVRRKARRRAKLSLATATPWRGCTGICRGKPSGGGLPSSPPGALRQPSVAREGLKPAGPRPWARSLATKARSASAEPPRAGKRLGENSCQ